MFLARTRVAGRPRRGARHRGWAWAVTRWSSGLSSNSCVRTRGVPRIH